MDTQSATTHHIAAAVRDLDCRRREAAEVDGQLAERQAAFEAENRDLFAAVQERRKLLRSAESVLRELLVTHYNHTKKLSPDDQGDKTPFPGVGVKVGTAFEYDRDAALSWAHEKGLCLLPEQLDVKAFNDLCKSESNRPAFVKVIETPTAQIATDLGKTITAIAAAPVVPEVEEAEDEGAETPQEAPAAAGDVE